MMFIVSIAMIIVGYTLFYYSVGLWTYYRLSNKIANAPATGAGNGLSLSYLFGFSTPAMNGPNLPFDESGGSGVTTGSNTVTPSTGISGGSGVQSV